MKSYPSIPVRVLVVEDSEDDTFLLSRQLEKAGMIGQVKFVRDGYEALECLTSDEGIFSANLMVIFLDLKLPGLGGLELLARIKSMKSASRIPVVVMTSSQDPLDLETCRTLGVANYVEKPVTFSSFAKSMADVFHVRRSTRTDRLPIIRRPG